MHLSAWAKLISRTDLEAIIFVVRFLIKKSIFAVLKKYDSVPAMETNWREVTTIKMVVSRLKANTGGCAVVDGVPLSSAGVPLVEGGAVPLYAHVPRLIPYLASGGLVLSVQVFKLPPS